MGRPVSAHQSALSRLPHICQEEVAFSDQASLSCGCDGVAGGPGTRSDVELGALTVFLPLNSSLTMHEQASRNLHP